MTKEVQSKAKKRDIRICERKHKIIALIILLLFTVIIHSTCFANDENTITNDFEINLKHSSDDGECNYGSYITKDGELILLSVSAKDYNLPSNLFEYKKYIRLRMTYSQVDYKVLDCKVIDYKTGEVIEDLSEENLNQLFDIEKIEIEDLSKEKIEQGKNITEKIWVDTIKLSELKENEIYKFTADSKVQFPKIENDTEKNCIIYINEENKPFNENYQKKINMYKEISGSSIKISFNEYNSGDSFNIMYRKIENEELLKLIKEDEIIYLSKYNDGDSLEFDISTEYIYNDTEKNITIHTKDTAFGEETTKPFTIEKGKIYGFDWMIDSATISYSENKQEEHKRRKC